MGLSAKIYERGPLYQGSVKDFAVTNLGVYQSETTQRFMPGTRYLTWDGRVYKYAYSGGACRSSHGCHRILAQALGWKALSATCPAGSDFVTITTAGSEPGSDGSGNSIFTKDSLQGGYICLFDGGTTVSGLRGITGNDALATGGGVLKVYLDVPLNIELVATTDIAEITMSPYYAVKYSSNETAGICGIPTIAIAASGSWFWVQTWGPVWVVPQGLFGRNKDAGTHRWQGVFRADGSVDAHHNSAATGGSGTNYHQQHAGFIFASASDKGQGAPFFMLQISI